MLGVVALLIATPLGVGSAIYLTEYTYTSRLTRAIRFGTESLAGVPSIIFGLFGFLFFVNYLQMGWSISAGGLTLALMVLPTIIRTAEEAIQTVPHAYRDVSYSLGATRWEMVTTSVLPSAMPGHRHRHHPVVRPGRQRDSGGDLYRWHGPKPAGLAVLAGAHHGGAFLHPGGRGHLARKGLCHRRSADYYDPADQYRRQYAGEPGDRPARSEDKVLCMLEFSVTRIEAA